eukprot:Pgem_evm1s18248
MKSFQFVLSLTLLITPNVIAQQQWGGYQGGQGFGGQVNGQGNQQPFQQGTGQGFGGQANRQGNQLPFPQGTQQSFQQFRTPQTIPQNTQQTISQFQGTPPTIPQGNQRTQAIPQGTQQTIPQFQGTPQAIPGSGKGSCYADINFIIDKSGSLQDDPNRGNMGMFGMFGRASDGKTKQQRVY